MKTQVRLYVICLMGLLGLATNAVQAAAPPMINYQGYLTDAVGTPLNETVDMGFWLYDEETGGDLLWYEFHRDIVVSEGIFNVILGSGESYSDVPFWASRLGEPLPFDMPYYLEIWVNGEKMAPRRPLLSVPYALNAKPTAAPAPGSGPVSISPYQECVDIDGNRDCKDKALLTVAVARGATVWLEWLRQEEVVYPGGDTIVVEETVPIRLTRRGDTITCTIEKGSDSFSFTLSPAAPLYDGLTNGAPVDVRGQLLTDSLVALAVESELPSQLGQIIIESIGNFTASVRSLGTHHVQLTVEVVNNGDLSAVYLVTVPTCNACDDLVPAQSTTIEPREEKTFTFTLYSADGFTTGNTCVVELRSPTGRLFDKQTITLQ